MSSPTSPLPTIAVTGKFATLANRPADGYIALTPVAPVAGAGWIIIGATVEALVRNGQLNTTIVADSDQLSADLYVRVVERIDDAAPQSYVVRPEGTTLDLVTAPRTGDPPPNQLYVPATALGQPNGVATLGPDGILVASQRPASSGGPGVSDHGALTGLTPDDDHPQYLTTARGDARYPTQAAVDAAVAGKANIGHGHTASQISDFTAVVDARIAPVVGGAPGALNTLDKLAAALGDDPLFAANTANEFAGRQPLNPSLTAIAGLAPNDDDVLQRKSGNWAARSIDQLKADLALTYNDLAGIVPSSALSPLMINDVFVVNSQAAMLALSAERGDIAVRTDTGRTHVLATDNPAALANWKEILAAGQVQSVAGRTGVVALTKTDVGLSNVDDTPDLAKPVSAATQILLDEKVSLSLVDAAGDLLVGTGNDTVARLPAGGSGTTLVADPTQPTGLRWAAPSRSPVATRYGCLAITMDPHDLSWTTPQYLGLVDFRHYQYWVPVVPGELISSVRLPVQLQGSGAGALHFAVYQESLAQLGTTGDVAAALSNPAVAQTWQTLPLTAPAAATGNGIWITALSTMSSGPKVAFSNTSGTAELPGWLLNPATHRTAVRTEGVSTLPATIDPTNAITYIDFLIGVA